jgi:hypothetical protein
MAKKVKYIIVFFSATGVYSQIDTEKNEQIAIGNTSKMLLIPTEIMFEMMVAYTDCLKNIRQKIMDNNIITGNVIGDMLFLIKLITIDESKENRMLEKCCAFVGIIFCILL